MIEKKFEILILSDRAHYLVRLKNNAKDRMRVAIMHAKNAECALFTLYINIYLFRDTASLVIGYLPRVSVSSQPTSWQQLVNMKDTEQLELV